MADPIKIKTLIDADKAKADVRVNPSDLDNGFIEQASLYEHYGRLAAQAERQVNDLDLILEVKISQVAKAMRNKPLAEGEKKPSEAQLDKDVLLHPDVIQLRRAINEAKMVHSIAKTTLKALEQRRDMLVGLGAKDREVMKGELRMTARREVEATDVRNRALAAAGRAGE
jgi:hypothetical protein